jgi:hypothetical protein
MTIPKKILVPTDFRVASLHPLRLALELIEEQPVDVVLLYCQTLDDSITELLFYSSTRIIEDVSTADFEDAISILRNRFEYKIGTLQIELFHSHAQHAFDTLLATLGIDAIFIAQSYPLHLGKRAFDPRPYIEKCPVPHYKLGLGQQSDLSEADKLENLFLY